MLSWNEPDGGGTASDDAPHETYLAPLALLDVAHMWNLATSERMLVRLNTLSPYSSLCDGGMNKRDCRRRDSAQAM